MSLRTYYQKFENLAARLQSPLLLVIRLYWGWQFFLSGTGKLMHLDRTARFFGEELHLPWPKLNAILAGSTECFGGLLLVVGLFSRVVSVPLAFTMIVAYLTADTEALRAVFSDPDKFLGAAPFLFLLASVVVLAFGPGKFSVDYFWERRRTGTKTPGLA